MAAVHVGEITEVEIPEVAEFLARQVPSGEAKSAGSLSPRDRLRWLLLDNPARATDIPFGWRIRGDAGQVVGAAICSPFRICSRSITCTALMFSKFYVDVPFRGMGLGLLMRFVRMAATFPLFCTSTNAVAGALFARVGASQIDGLDHTMLESARPGHLIEEWIYRTTHMKLAARILSAPAHLAPRRMARISAMGESSGTLFPIITSGDLASLDLALPDDVTAVVRDEQYLQWRYLSGEKDKQLFRYRYPAEADRLIVVNELRAGYRGQIRVLNVLDVWPPTTATSAPALCGKLSLRYQGRFDTLWLRSQPPASEEALARAGFVHRTFPAPLGWYIDREKKLVNRKWYVMPGESE